LAPGEGNIHKISPLLRVWPSSRNFVLGLHV
jgi:hypothetical protein